jgi:hypothetical protein
MVGSLKSASKVIRAVFLLVGVLGGAFLCMRAFEERLWPIADKVLYRSVSPDRRFDAIVFTRDAGATTRISYCIAIVPRGETSLQQQVFQADSIDDKEDLIVKWEGQTLLIGFPKPARVFRQLPAVSVDSVTVPIKYFVSPDLRSGVGL